MLDTQKTRITFFDRGSDQLIITFNSMGLSLEDDFGRAFFADLNLSQINVACAEKDFFQSLSQEEFQATVSPFLDAHTDIITYGTSLGGYGALYFGICIKARTLAIAPRLPPHPYMEGLRSFIPDFPLQHKDLTALPPSRGLATLIYDPEEEADIAFVHRFYGKRDEVDFIPLKGAGHYILKQLNLIGKLKPCVTSFIRENDFKADTIDTSAFTLARRKRAQDALDTGDLASAREEITYLTRIRTGHDPFMTPWGLIKTYVEQCDIIDIELPKILPTEYATLSRRMGQPPTPQKAMEALIKHMFLTCQYEACLTTAELAAEKYPDSTVANAYVQRAGEILGKMKR